MHRRAAIDFTKRWLRRLAWAALTAWVGLFLASFVAPIRAGQSTGIPFTMINKRGVVADRGAVTASWVTQWETYTDQASTSDRYDLVMSASPNAVAAGTLREVDIYNLAERASRDDQSPNWFGAAIGFHDVPVVNVDYGTVGRVPGLVSFRAAGLCVGIAPNAIIAILWLVLTFYGLKRIGAYRLNTWMLCWRPRVRQAPLILLTAYVMFFATSWVRSSYVGIRYNALDRTGRGVFANRGTVAIEWAHLEYPIDWDIVRWSAGVETGAPTPDVLNLFRGPESLLPVDLRAAKWGELVLPTARSPLTPKVSNFVPATTSRLVIGRYPSMAIVALWLLLVVRWSIKRMRRPAGRGFEVDVTGQPASPDAVARNS